MLIPNLRVDYKGSAHASSSWGQHPAENAFKPQNAGSWPWANHRDNNFPHFVWFQFESPIVLAKIGFSSRAGQNQNQMVKKFDVIGATASGCSDIQDSPRILLGVEDAGFERSSQAKVWLIPEKNQAPYLCIGIKIHSGSVLSTVVSVQNMVMWERRF